MCSPSLLREVITLLVPGEEVEVYDSVFCDFDHFRAFPCRWSVLDGLVVLCLVVYDKVCEGIVCLNSGTEEVDRRSEHDGH